MMNDIYVEQNTALRCWLHSSGLLTGSGACRVETKQWTCHPPSLPGSRDDGDITLLTYHITSDTVTLQILFDINSACLLRNEANARCFSLQKFEYHKMDTNMLFETCYICQQTLQPIIYHTICFKGDNPNSKMLIQYILPKTVCDQVWLVLAVRWAQWTLPGKQNNDKCIRCAAIRQPSWKLQQYHSEWVRQIGCGQLSGIQRGEAWCLPQLTWLRHWIMIALQTTD